MDSAVVTTDAGNIDHERQALIRKIVLAVGTPTYIYDAVALRQRLALVRQHFEVVRFAQKALPTSTFCGCCAWVTRSSTVFQRASSRARWRRVSAPV